MKKKRNFHNAVLQTILCLGKRGKVELKDFKAIAIVCSGDQPAYPCGICRQVMSEFFNPDTRIIVEEGGGLKTYTMSEILPDSFSL